jgi:hypothetical protein
MTKSDAQTVLEALMNVSGNVYHGMVNDVGYAHRSPDWQYIKTQCEQALPAAQRLVDADKPTCLSHKSAMESAQRVAQLGADIAREKAEAVLTTAGVKYVE